MLNNLSDLLALPETFFFEQNELEKMISLNKISRDSISLNILNSYSLFTIAYSGAIIVNLLIDLMRIVTQRKFNFVKEKLKKIEFFILEMSFAEMIFYLCTASVDFYDPNKYSDPKYIVSKVLTFSLLLKIGYEIFSMIFLMADTYNIKDERKAFYYEIFEENFHPKIFKEKKIVRILEPLFRLKLVTFVIFIASF